MKCESEEAIMSSSKASDIFTMNASTIEMEMKEYVKRFKPKDYSKIKNFILTQKINFLYQQALNQLGNNEIETMEVCLTITKMDGETYKYDCNYSYDIKIGKMYVTDDNIIFIIDQQKENYYKNYIEKTKKFPKLDKEIWNSTEYMFPKVSKHFQTKEGKWAIFVDKPCRMYPLREILNYFNGKLNPQYVASILTRLYYFECYLDLIGINHNGITVDNIFFAPGRTIKDGESFTVDDMRIVGVFGGWFFTTWSDQKLTGLPQKIFESLPTDSKTSGFSSFKVDVLSIKMVARELLGDISGENLVGVPETFLYWVNSNDIAKNAYEEFCIWEKVVTQSFGGHRFVEIDVSID